MHIFQSHLCAPAVGSTGMIIATNKTKILLIGKMLRKSVQKLEGVLLLFILMRKTISFFKHQTMLLHGLVGMTCQQKVHGFGVMDLQGATLTGTVDNQITMAIKTVRQLAILQKNGMMMVAQPNASLSAR